MLKISWSYFLLGVWINFAVIIDVVLIPCENKNIKKIKIFFERSFCHQLNNEISLEVNAVMLICRHFVSILQYADCTYLVIQNEMYLQEIIDIVARENQSNVLVWMAKKRGQG